jgi:transposase InsO family protein
VCGASWRRLGWLGVTRRCSGRSKAATLAAVGREVRVAEDLVHRDFKVDAPDWWWFVDIAEHPTDAGKLYVGSFLDVFDKQMVGWSIGENATSSLVVNAARDGGRALQSGHPTRASQRSRYAEYERRLHGSPGTIGLDPECGFSWGC